MIRKKDNKNQHRARSQFIADVNRSIAVSPFAQKFPSRFFASAVVCIGLFCYAVWVEPEWIDVRVHTFGRDKGQDNIRVILLSDLHLQSIGRYENKIAEAVLQAKPDLIIFSGYTIDRSDALPTLKTFLALLGPTPAFAVLGNWEHWSGVNVQALRFLFESRPNTKLLVNEMGLFNVRSRSIRVFGFDDFTAGTPRLDGFTFDASTTTIAVQHSPGWFESLELENWPGEFNLCLSGHTHGGQITLFGLPLWTPKGSGDFTSGLYMRSICPIYVSKGLGTSILPLRFGSRPEIAVFDI